MITVGDAERRGMHSHAERGNEGSSGRSFRVFSCPFVEDS
jgi:hypothetical protein